MNLQMFLCLGYQNEGYSVYKWVILQWCLYGRIEEVYGYPFYDSGRVVVGYEFTVYIADGEGTAVEICARIYEPPTGGSPREFVVSSTTQNGSASKRIHEGTLPISMMCIISVVGACYVGQTVNLLFVRGSLREFPYWMLICVHLALITLHASFLEPHSCW